MKSIIYLKKHLTKAIFTLLLVSIVSCSENTKNIKSNDHYLSGKIKNIEDGTLVMLKAFNSNSKAIDSSFVKNKKFKLNFNKNKQGLYLLKFKDSKDSSLFYFDFWFEKKNINITGDFNLKEDIKINNSNINDFIRNYRNIPKKYNKKIEKAFENVTDDEKIEIIFQKFKDSIENDQIDLLFSKPDNLFSINEITRYKHKISKERLETFFKKLNNNLKLSPEGQILEEYLSSQQVEIGKPLVDFMASELNGKKVNLSNFKGKIILLDFWAFWCTWCHVQNKEEFSYLNKKYKKDLVIISYSLDEKETIWNKSVKKDSYKWVNLSNLKGIKDPIAYKYKVNTLPHSFLIDKEGIIIKEFIGYNKDSLIETEIKKLILN